MYAGKMMTLCIRYCGNREDARDALQEGFIHVYDHLNDYRGEGSFDGWIRKIFVNASLVHLRKSYVKYEKASIHEVDWEPEDHSLVDQYAATELLEYVAELPGGYRVVFNLFAIEGYTHREIARMLKISETTSRTQFFKARKVLRAKLSRQEATTL